jgi:hypothetical protein
MILVARVFHLTKWNVRIGIESICQANRIPLRKVEYVEEIATKLQIQSLNSHDLEYFETFYTIED